MLLRAYLKRDEAEWALDQRSPTPDMEEASRLLSPDGEQTEERKQFCKDKWTRKNGIAYSAIVEECEGHTGAMLVVMQRKASDNAKEMYDVLLIINANSVCITLRCCKWSWLTLTA